MHIWITRMDGNTRKTWNKHGNKRKTWNKEDTRQVLFDLTDQRDKLTWQTRDSIWIRQRCKRLFKWNKTNESVMWHWHLQTNNVSLLLYKQSWRNSSLFPSLVLMSLKLNDVKTHNPLFLPQNQRTEIVQFCKKWVEILRFSRVLLV